MENNVVTDSKEYQNIHRWLVRHHGKATQCLGESCTRKSVAYQYALRRGFGHAKNRDHYIELCASCHRLYDQQPEWSQKQAATLKGRKMPAEQRANLSASLRASFAITPRPHGSRSMPVEQLTLQGNLVKEWPSMSAAAKGLGINPSRIWRACRGQLNQTGGFQWRQIA